jgi:Rps23 Pro-64 3,4-dihydroxylase Tpa1-like proline 4-hydroxylase
MNNIYKNEIVKKILDADILNKPFDHCIIDNFLPHELANNLSKEFPSYDSDTWFNYKNKIEDKKVLSDWRKFSENTYQTFSFLNSNFILESLSNKFNVRLYSDIGLHGGGWHIHGNGGKLNPHLDYSIHPQLKQQRKLNLIIYLCEDWQENYGGHFGLWSHDTQTKKANKLEKEISVGFNKAVIFDTTQNSWHGLSREVNTPINIYRKSLAIYYLCDPTTETDTRGRALFSPTEQQKGDKGIEDLISQRSDIAKSKNVYIQ